MTGYEILLLLDPDVGDGRETEIVGRVRELVERGGGSWDLHDPWGRRRLAYEIDHKQDGSYHLLQFTSNAETLEEISRVLRIDDGVMRHMATRRIAGSPARPVAAPAPAREDAGTQSAGARSAETQSAEREPAEAQAAGTASEPEEEE